MDFALSDEQSALKSVMAEFVNREIMPYAAEWDRAEQVDLSIVGKLAELDSGSGSDAGSLATRAERKGDSWLLSGNKMFITNGTWAKVAIIFARTGGPGPRGITVFLVPTDRPGFSVREIKGKLGLRGQATAELILDSVEVPDAWRLGEEGRGFSIAMSTLDKGRMSLAAGCIGIGQGCLDATVEYSQQRIQFGRPIASFQLVQSLISDIAVETQAARLLVWRVADLIDRGQPFATDASIAKLYASEMAVRAANNALQVFGGYGYIDEFMVGKYLRDARVTTVYEGTSQVQRLIIGRSLTGVSAFN